MRRLLITCLVLTGVFGCTKKNQYDVKNLYSKAEQDSVLSDIITYIFIAPPYTSMADRFESTHRSFYTDSKTTSLFSIDQYYISDNGTNYFFVLRAGSRVGEKRGVGGYFKRDSHKNIHGFREVFVTPIMSEEDARSKGAFLFDKLVKGDINQYLQMKSYVQWPNEASHYDTVKYEWTLDQMH